jgi:tetratricopeptide (TPR) repeat protein
LYPHVLVDRVMPGRRLRIHRRLAEWIEQTWGERAAVIAGPLALHYEEAGDYQRAIFHLRRAAEGDVRRWAYREAIARLTRAVALVEHLPSADAETEYPALLDQLGRVHRGLGDLPGTLQVFDALAAWARERGQIQWLAIASRYRASTLIWTDPGESRAANAEGLALSARIDDPVVRAKVQGFGAYWQWLVHGRRADDARRVEAALAAARVANDRELVGQSHDWLATFQFAASDFRTAADTAAEGIEIARDVGDVYTYLSCHHRRAQALQQLGEWGSTVTTLAEGLRMATQIGHRSWASILRSEEASLHAEGFDFVTAAAIAREELAQNSLATIARHRATVELGVALLGLGNLEEAYAAFTSPELVRAAELAAIPWFEQVVRMRHGIARVWLARGDLERARHAAESFQALVDAADEPTPRALAAELLAEVSLQEGRASQAEVHLRQAADAIEGRQAPGLEWRIAAIAARVLDRQRRTADADAARARSAAIVTRLADSLPAAHPLRAAFLAHATVRAILHPRTRSRRRS